MQLTITNEQGAGVGVEVSDAVFSVAYNEPLVHQIVTAYLAASRAGTKAQKTRSEVSGGGAKPWRQKGTGRARAGTTRSPIWRSGGVAFAARPRSFEQKVNRKMYRAGMRSILSELVRQERLKVVDEFHLESNKTRDAVNRLNALNLTRATIVVDSMDENLYLATRNIPHVYVMEASDINPVDLVASEQVVMTKAAVEQIEGQLK